MTAMPAAAGLPPRIEKLRLALAQEIPRFPNDRATFREMEQKHLNELLLHYVNWRARYVGVRPRQIQVEALALHDPRWPRLWPSIQAFLEKVDRGDDLTPHLSLLPHKRGYSLRPFVPGGPSAQKWRDKDFLLTSTGYHHFHLEPAKEEDGHAHGPDEMIFAEVGRDTFKVIAVFDHSVFEMNSPEHQRLGAIHDQIIFRGQPPGAMIIRGMVTTSGHSVHVVRYADYCSWVARSLDARLEDGAYVESLYAQAKVPPPPESEFEWRFNHLDLVAYDKAGHVGFVMQQGWN